MGVKKLIFIFLLGFSCISFARLNLSEGEITSKISHQKKQVQGLEKKLRGIEKLLDKKNNDFLTGQKQIRSVENTLFHLRTEIDIQKKELGEKINKVKKVLTTYVANGLSPDDSKVMLRKKVLVKILKEKLKGLQATQDQLAGQDGIVKSLREKVFDMQKEQQNLVTLLTELEREKSSVAKTYLDAVGVKNKLLERNSFLKKKRELSKSLENSVKFTFGAPLKNHTGIEYQKKGVTFKFRGQGPVVSTRDGKIAYVGSLASYGNVMMIDHGSETRTILLGGFLPKLKKGVSVKKGELLGYTKGRAGEGKLYFEVRKKNKAQNTFVLMDKEFISRNNIGQQKSI